jgi:hypothetical protein
VRDEEGENPKRIHLFSEDRAQGEDWLTNKEPQIVIILIFFVSADGNQGMG